MSQVTKRAGGGMPLRKRLKPTVNLNVAARRRKDSKNSSPQTDVSADVLPEKSESKKNGFEATAEDDMSRRTTDTPKETSVTEKEKLLDTSSESISTKSISSAKTVILDHVSGNAHGEEIGKEHLEVSDKRNSPRISISSSVSTIVWKNSKGNVSKSLDQSLDSLDELVELGTSNIDLGSCSSTVPYVLDKVNEKTENESLNSKNNSGKSIVSDKLLHNSRSNHFVKDLEKDIEILNPSENGSKKSGASSISADLASEGNVDTENLNDDNVSSVSENSQVRDDFSPPKYKRKVSSMAKRLSEARRDFESRYCDKKPERSSLRMFDLIYYNPSSNPMKTTADKPKEIVHPVPDAVEEDIDDPADEENSVENENDSGIPAPRVKVGPNGEIVLDEQSLVIETTQSKKSRQEIANLTVVVDTGSSTTYHTYSKKKRTRSDWTVKETVRFYKALQTLGTDFSLMQTLFPSRTRLDLKAKFKKEEKINGELIEKALRFPSLFDLSELEKEPPAEIKKETVEKKPKVSQKRPRKRTLKALGFDDEDNGPTLKKKKKKHEAKTLRNHNKDTGKENVETHNNECISDEEYHPSLGEQGKNDGPKGVTERRSSRVLNGKTPNYAAVENKHDFLEAGVDLLELSDDEEEEEEAATAAAAVEENNVEEEHNFEESAPVVSDFDMNNVPPGSLVILTSQHPDNPVHRICKVFMVQERPEASYENIDASSSLEEFSHPNTLDTPIVNNENETEPR